MPKLAFPYVRPDPAGGAYPIIPVWLVNLQSGQRIRVYALVDTGADVCLFNSALLQHLGVDVSNMPATMPLTGINAGAPLMGWQFPFGLGVATDTSPEIFWPNGRLSPVPVVFNPNVQMNLLGRSSFLDRCVVTANAWIGQVALEF